MRDTTNSITSLFFFILNQKVLYMYEHRVSEHNHVEHLHHVKLF